MYLVADLVDLGPTDEVVTGGIEDELVLRQAGAGRGRQNEGDPGLTRCGARIVERRHARDVGECAIQRCGQLRVERVDVQDLADPEESLVVS